VRAFVSTQDHRAEHLRQPGAEVAAGDLREIADVEPGAGNNRAAGKATASSFLNSDARLRVPAGGVVSARGMGCRCAERDAEPQLNPPQTAKRLAAATRYRCAVTGMADHKANAAGSRCDRPARLAHPTA
jgi:hypothetical protein